MKGPAPLRRGSCDSSSCSPRVSLDPQDQRATEEMMAPAAMRSVLLHHHLRRRELRGDQEMLPIKTVNKSHRSWKPFSGDKVRCQLPGRHLKVFLVDP